jgi:hypothetical protein
MLREHTGDATLEWIVVAALAIAIVGAALYGVFQSIANKLNEVNTQIGS